MSMKNERLQVLEMIENGVITAEEGARLLNALGEHASSSADDVDFLPSNSKDAINSGFSPPASRSSFVSEDPVPGYANEAGDRTFETSMQHWQRWWLIPMWVGIAITVASGILMFAALQTSGIGFWFGCAWVPFLLGVGVMALAWASRTSRWLHLRIHRKPGESPQSILLSFPLPLRVVAWFFRTFGKSIPQLKNTGVDELVLALEKTTGPENPFYLEVAEGEDGERVQVYIG
jgi:hypothetical protein